MGTAKVGWSAARAWRWAVASSGALGAAPDKETRRLSRLALWQGGYFVTTGLWPLVHRRSLVAVTGPRPQGWMGKTVGLLAAAIGALLLRAGRRGAVDDDLRLLATASAASFAAVDVWHASTRRISPLYLADAVIEVAFVAAWLLPQGHDHAADLTSTPH